MLENIHKLPKLMLIFLKNPLMSLLKIVSFFKISSYLHKFFDSLSNFPNLDLILQYLINILKT